MLAKSGQAKWSFVMFYVFFLSFIVFMLGLPDSPLVDVVETSLGESLTPPSCTIGILAPIDIIICAVQYVAYFGQFMVISIAEGYAWLWGLLFAPMIIILGWVIAEFIRGSS